jgi:hypothetical protein
MKRNLSVFWLAGGLLLSGVGVAQSGPVEILQLYGSSQETRAAAPGTLKVAEGDWVSFWIICTPPPNSYQWFKNGLPLAGATNQAIDISEVQPADAGWYSARVTVVGVGSVSTGSIDLEVFPPLVVKQAPPNPVPLGANVTLTVEVQGATVSNVEWRFEDDRDVLGTNATLTLANISFRQDGEYQVEAYHSLLGHPSCTSHKVAVYPSLSAPIIMTAPQAQTGRPGGSAVFTVGVSGSAPFTYQWQKNGVAISGATNFYLALSNLQAADAANYRVVVSNVVGSVTSAAAALTVANAPTPNASATSLVNAGRQLLSQQSSTNLSAAAAKFASAVATDASHELGNFFYGVTRVIDVLNQTAANQLLDRFLVDKTGRNVYAWTAEPAQDPFGDLIAPAGVNANEVPAFLRDQLLPQLKNALANFAKVKDATFSVGLSEEETTTADVVVDQADLYVARAALNAAEYFIRTVNSWNLSAQLTALKTLADDSQLTLERLRRDYPQLLTFADASQIAPAKAALEAAVDAYVQAAGLIRTRAAGVRHVFNLDAADFDKEGEFRQMALDLKASLSGAMVLNQKPQLIARLGKLTDGSKAPATLLPGFVQNHPDASQLADVTFNGAFQAVGRPVILIQPFDRAVPAGGQVTLAVAATGAAPLRYQWLVWSPDRPEGSAIAGATNATLTLRNIQSEAWYWVDVSNVYGEASSKEAWVGVMRPPQIVGVSGPGTVQSGQNVQFSVSAQGTQPLSYQWRFNGVALTDSDWVDGTKRDRLTLRQVNPTNAGIYSIVITNAAGSVTSNVTTLTVNVAPLAITSASPLPGGTVGNPYQQSLQATGGVAPYAWTIVTGNLPPGLSLSTSGVISGAPTFAGTFNFQANVADKSTPANLAAKSFALTIVPPDVVWWAITKMQLFEQTGSGAPQPLASHGWQAGAALQPAPGQLRTVQWVRLTFGTNSVDLKLYGPRFAVTAEVNSKAELDAMAPNGAAYTLTWSSLNYGQRSSTLSAPAADNYPAAAPTIQDLPGLNALTPGEAATIRWQPFTGGTASDFIFVEVFPIDGSDPLIASPGLGMAGALDGTATSFSIPADLLGVGVTYDVKIVFLKVTSRDTTTLAGATGGIGFGKMTSAQIKTTGPAAPTITQPPASLGVAQGGSASFSVKATGSPAPTYQWLHDGVALVDDIRISGSGANLLTITNVQPGDAGGYSVIVSNPLGTVTSSPPAILTVLVPPTIAQQPADKTAVQGGTAVFTVEAAGTGPLSYQWKRGTAVLTEGANIMGSRSNILTLMNLTTNDSGATFSVTVSNSVGTVTSRAATLTVVLQDQAPLIVAQPQNERVPLGADATFSVVVSAYPPPAFRWLSNGVALVNGGRVSGAASASVTIGNVTTNDDGTAYSVIITNQVGATTSVVAVLSVVVPPAILEQPASLTVSRGQEATFQVFATGTAPLSYQWQFNGTNLAGATEPGLTLTNVQPSQAGNYRVVVTNLAAVVASSNATLTVLVPPAFTQQPLSQTACAGANVAFSASASGTPAPTYQWRKDGAPLAGQTASTLDLMNVQSADAGVYDVIASNGAGSVTSLVAQLTVKLPPTIVQQPKDQAATPGSSVQFDVVASGGGPYTYQWRKDSTDLAGATNAVLVLMNVQTNAAGSYSVHVSNDCGSTNSASASLVIVNRSLRVISTNAVAGGPVGIAVELVGNGTENQARFSLAFGGAVLNFTNVVLGSGATNATLTWSNLPNGEVLVDVGLPTNQVFGAGATQLAVLEGAVAEALTNTTVAVVAFGSVGQVLDVSGSALPYTPIAGLVTIPGVVPPELNTVSGLFEQKLEVALPAGGVPAGQALMVLVYDLGNDSKGRPIQLYNRTGVTNGTPYLLLNGPLAGGATLPVSVQYIVLDRRTVPNPRFVVTSVAGVGPQTVSGSATLIDAKNTKFKDGVLYLQFQTISGRTYYVQYKDSLNDADWKTAWPPITGTGGWVVWLDNGPPKTASAPTEAGARFYQVILTP